MTFDLASALWPVTSSPAMASTAFEYDGDVEVAIGLSSRVLLFNDNHHTFDEVIGQVCKATGCSADHAESIAWEVHSKGKSMVFEGEMMDCLRVSSVLEEIALHTQVLT